MKFAGDQVYTWHLAVRKPSRRHTTKVTVAPPRRFVTRLDLFPCPQCHADVDVAQQARNLRPPRSHHFWRLDMRRETVQCAQCKKCFPVFAYLLFNWVPPYRIITGLVLLVALAGVLLLVSAW
ncbi:MAG: hypothetical protein ACHQ9S_27370 [Candidatus Binatia bacterium]